MPEDADRARGPIERERLHREVQSFIDCAAEGRTPAVSFEELALSVVRYQVEHVPAYARLCAATRRGPGDVNDPRELPAMPSEAFRLARIAAHPLADDAVVFRTSGTSSGARGEHALSTTLTYERAALAWGRWALFCDRAPALSAIVLGPQWQDARDSSLSFMIDLFARRLASISVFLPVAADEPPAGERLERMCEEALRRKVPAIVFGTSFSFVHWLDALRGKRLALPAGSRAMHTGGFKGRSREVAPDELRAAIASTFGIATHAVVGEYGMTELSSQLYEGTLRAAAGLPAPASRHGIFVPPPWLRVVPVDPDTLAPVPTGEIGILRFEDLANVDSALAVQTADRGRLIDGGVELLGRSPGAPPRGCSLVVAELFGW